MKAKKGLLRFTLALGAAVITAMAAPVAGLASESGSDAASDFYNKFPDATFRKYLTDNWDKNNDGVLSKAEIQSVDSIDCHNMDIYSLQGIENFTSLKYLDWSFTYVTELDVSNLANLT